MGNKDYQRQHRGNRGAYRRYLEGMDASMRQKVALTAAHLFGEGVIADMGMGSGTGSHALAALYPALTVVGVDVSETMVALATERYQLPNLRFVVGDIAKSVFGKGELDCILDSSVLHHVTTFSDYDHDAARRALEVQVSQLANGGVLVVRDFVAPEDEIVTLDLPAEDHRRGDEVGALSTADLFERFAVEFRKLAEQPGFAYERLTDPRPGWRRYQLHSKHAIEFILRKDYRRDWDTEVLEEYTYFTQRMFEECFAALGLRVLASSPIRNPWIVANRFLGQFELRNSSGALMDVPATNYIIVGERVDNGHGVAFSEGTAREPAFVTLEHYRDNRTGKILDLAFRPNRTIDIIPWFEVDGDHFVLARKSYPRPILCSTRAQPSIDGGLAVGYVSEPLNVLQTDRPLGQTVELALERFASIRPTSIVRIDPAARYYPSPGGVQEEVRAVRVQVEPVFVERDIDNLSGFASSGQVRAIEAQQLLRAAQVGALPDARLELNAYDLLLARGADVGPWIGATLEVADLCTENTANASTALAQAVPRRVFEGAATGAGFLEVLSAEFCEHDGTGNTVAVGVRDYVVPTTLSTNSVALALVSAVNGAICLAVDDHDLPAVQAFTGHSNLLVAPAWRLPTSITSSTAAAAWLSQRLGQQHGISARDFLPLGGPYYPSPGTTPELVTPMIATAFAEQAATYPLQWLPLHELVDSMAAIEDGHLKVVALRAAHALGVLEQRTRI